MLLFPREGRTCSLSRTKGPPGSTASVVEYTRRGSTSHRSATEPIERISTMRSEGSDSLPARERNASCLALVGARVRACLGGGCLCVCVTNRVRRADLLGVVVERLALGVGHTLLLRATKVLVVQRPALLHNATTRANGENTAQSQRRSSMTRMLRHASYPAANASRHRIEPPDRPGKKKGSAQARGRRRARPLQKTGSCRAADTEGLCARDQACQKERDALHTAVCLSVGVVACLLRAVRCVEHNQAAGGLSVCLASALTLLLSTDVEKR
jgi:hypothetical protein